MVAFERKIHSGTSITIITYLSIYIDVFMRIQEEKRLLTRDVIQSVGDGQFSRVEVAFSLLIGQGKPEDTTLTSLGIYLHSK